MNLAQYKQQYKRAATKATRDKICKRAIETLDNDKSTEFVQFVKTDQNKGVFT